MTYDITCVPNVFVRYVRYTFVRYVRYVRYDFCPLRIRYVRYVRYIRYIRYIRYVRYESLKGKGEETEEGPGELIPMGEFICGRVCVVEVYVVGL
jgi:hypothetical protein